jgi:hypothetical protein
MMARADMVIDIGPLVQALKKIDQGLKEKRIVFLNSERGELFDLQEWINTTIEDEGINGMKAYYWDKELGCYKASLEPLIRLPEIPVYFDIDGNIIEKPQEANSDPQS